MFQGHIACSRITSRVPSPNMLEVSLKCRLSLALCRSNQVPEGQGPARLSQRAGFCRCLCGELLGRGWGGSQLEEVQGEFRPSPASQTLLPAAGRAAPGFPAGQGLLRVSAQPTLEPAGQRACRNGRILQSCKSRTSLARSPLSPAFLHRPAPLGATSRLRAR